MCIHNEEEDYDCGKCCYDYGYLDAIEGFPSNPEYKDFWQCDEYYDGYTQGLKEKVSRNYEPNRKT